MVGAGIAGCAFAHAQSRAGRRVLLLERDLRQPDRIVGELLQPGGVLELERLGLGACLEGMDAQRVHGYCLVSEREETALLAYPCDPHASPERSLYDAPGAPPRLADADIAREDPGAAKGARRAQGALVAGRAFHNGRFVQRLRQAAQAAPGVTVRTATVRALVGAGGCDLREGEVAAGVRYVSKTAFSSRPGSNRESSGAAAASFVAKAHLTVVCEGMFSCLREAVAAPSMAAPSFFVGLILRDVELPHPNHGHVVLANPAPLLFYPISGSEVRCLVDVPGPRLPSPSKGDLERYLRRRVAPQIPFADLRDAFLRSLDAACPRSIQNKQLTARPRGIPGVVLLGDSWNMRHPLTGGGMTVALADARALTRLLEPLEDLRDAARVAEAAAQLGTARAPVAATINTLADALYRVFCDGGDAVPAGKEAGKGREGAAVGALLDGRGAALDGRARANGRTREDGIALSPPASPPLRRQAHLAMRKACFEYLQMGGECAAGPVGLLSGLRPRPLLLIAHFFSVAVFGMKQLLWPRPTLRGLLLAVLVLHAACGIILPILWREGLLTVFAPRLAPRPGPSRALRRKAQLLWK